MTLKITILFALLLVYCSAMSINEVVTVQDGAQRWLKDTRFKTRTKNDLLEREDLELTKIQPKSVDVSRGDSINDVPGEISESLNEKEVAVEETTLLNEIALEVPDITTELPTQLSETITNATAELEWVCGGVVESSDSGVLTYKENVNYENNENCEWTIQVPDAARIGFSLEVTELQECCDHITVSAVNSDGVPVNPPFQLKSTNRTTIITGARALLRFSTDKSVTGMGFRVRFQKLPDTISIEQDSKCGGVIIGDKGMLTYKSQTVYSNREKCVWLLHSPGSTSITLNLLHNGFEACCDFLLVNTIDPETGTISNETLEISENNRTETIESSLVVLLFHSDYSGTGAGFILEYSWSGNDPTPKYNYNLRHTSEPNGLVEFPDTQSSWYRSSTSGQDIHVIASSVEVNEEETQQVTAIDWKKHADSCGYDSFILYEPVSTDKSNLYKMWLKKDTLLNKNETTCSESNDVPSDRKNTISLEVPAFIAIFKVLPDHTNANFIFEYYRKPYECGGELKPLLDGEVGEIVYKENEYYSNNESCRWTFNVPESEVIGFTMQNGGFEECCDDLSITPFDADGEETAHSAFLKSVNRTVTISGSRGVVKFSSDKTNVGFGFRLRYHKLTTEEESGCGGILDPLTAEYGVISYKENENYSNIENCVWSINVPEAPIIGFTMETNGFEACCDYVNITSINESGGIQAQPIMLTAGIRRVTVPGPRALVKFTSDLTFVGNGFRLRYETFTGWGPDVDDICGGVLEPLTSEFGVIVYKENTEYSSRENCEWRINIPYAMRIAITLEKNGFETCCDYVTVISSDSEGNSHGPAIRLRSDNRTGIVTGPTAIVRFTSDSSENGKGFRVRYKKAPPPNDEICGGAITGEFGVINYKPGKEYLNNERCLWIVHAPNKASITLKLLEDGIDDCCDYIVVNTIDPNNGKIADDATLITWDNNTATKEGPIALIVFRSDSSGRGGGFSLEFSSSGKNPNPEITFHIAHNSNPGSTIGFPGSVWDHTPTSSNDIYVFGFSLNEGTEKDELSGMPTKLTWNSGAFGTSQHHCGVSFYTSPNQTAWNFVEDFPPSANCSETVETHAQPLITTSFPLFVAIYKPTDAFKDSFSFSYQMGSGCGGVYAQDAGEIAYKSDSTYGDNEHCVWLVHVPQAGTIEFELKKGEFEMNADYITISSLSPFTGVDHNFAVVTTEEQVVTVKGPVVMVTFISDHSMTGTGFQLKFRSEAQSISEPGITYRLFHKNQLDSDEFSYEAEPNQVAILAYSTEPRSRRENGTRINITSFNPQVDVSCNSDTLLIYDASGNNKNPAILRDTSTALSVKTLNNSVSLPLSCTPLEGAQVEVGAQTEHFVVTNTPSYLVMYSSLNEPNTLPSRGFAITTHAN